MGLRHNPVTYLILSNALLWALPLTLNLMQQGSLVDQDDQLTEIAEAKFSPQQQQLLYLEIGNPLDPTLQAEPHQQLGQFQTSAIATPIAMAEQPTTLLAQPSQVPITERGIAPISPPILINQLKGADGLGGPITLASRDEPLVPIAVRAERLQWQRSNDPLAALPLHWRDSLTQELGEGVQVSHANTVRLPVQDLAEREEVPLIITDQGFAEGLVEPRDMRTREAVEAWAARQQPAEPGTVQVILVAVEPLPPSKIEDY
jgi:hypothetical protein